jgi:hypothetical protein
VGRSLGRVVALVPNLMDRSRVEGPVRSLGASLDFVATPAELEVAVRAGAGVVVVDLAVPGVIDMLPRLDAVTVGFGSHVERDVLRRARAAGCDEVLTRSALAHRLPLFLDALRGGDSQEQDASPT